MEEIKNLFEQVTSEEIKEFINTLPANIRNMLPESEIELLDCIELLPDTISTGRILKITIDNYLDCEDEQGKNTADDRTGTSMGLLYALDDNSEVIIHEHKNDIETYVSIEKVLKMPKKIDDEQQELSANICPIGEKHGIGPMPKGTLIGTFKVRKDKVADYFTPKKQSHASPELDR